MAESFRCKGYGYRFAEKNMDSLFYLFAVGHDRITDPLYNWDGSKISDGPLYLFQYTKSGFGQIDIEGQSNPLPPGNAFMVEIPGNHRYYFPPSSDHWEFYYILFRPHHLTQLWNEMTLRTGPVIKINEESTPIRCLQQIYREACFNKIADVYKASAIVYQFYMELHRYCALGDPSEEKWPASIQAAIQYMNDCFDQPIGLDQISEQAGLSKFYFNRLFTKTTGYSPIAFLTRLRIEKAIELIHSTYLPMEQIANRIGFASGSYFTKIFKLYVGCSPSEYRSGKDTLSVSRLTFD